jgi:hypothetical protein
LASQNVQTIPPACFNNNKRPKMIFKSLHRRYEDLGTIRSIMMATLAAQRAVFPVQEYALADVRLHVALGCMGVLASAVAERALRIGYFDRALACAHGAVFCLSHIR